MSLIILSGIIPSVAKVPVLQLALTIPSGSVSFGTPPLRKSGSYSPSISHEGSYTPSITKTQVGDV